MTEEKVALEIRQLDQTRELCDGSLVGGLRKPRSERQRRKLKKRIAFEKDIIRKLKNTCLPQ